MPSLPVPVAAPDPFDPPFDGVLLDLDGTLIDSIPAVERSWMRWCEEFGVDPYRLVGMHGVTAAVQEREITPPSEINANVPAELSAICMRALARNPTDRYQSLKAMAVELEEFLDEAGYGDDDSKIATHLATMNEPPKQVKISMPPLERPASSTQPPPAKTRDGRERNAAAAEHDQAAGAVDARRATTREEQLRGSDRRRARERRPAAEHVERRDDDERTEQDVHRARLADRDVHVDGDGRAEARRVAGFRGACARTCARHRAAAPSKPRRRPRAHRSRRCRRSCHRARRRCAATGRRSPSRCRRRSRSPRSRPSTSRPSSRR